MSTQQELTTEELIRVELIAWVREWKLDQPSGYSPEAMADYIMNCLHRWNEASAVMDGEPPIITPDDLEQPKDTRELDALKKEAK